MNFPNGSQPSAMGPRPKMPQSVHFEDDFVCFCASTTANIGYLLTNPAGTGAVAAGSGTDGDGVLVLTTGTTANNTSVISLGGEPFKLPTTGRAVFQACFKVEDADEDAFFVGLHERGTLSSGDVLAEGTNDGFGFYADHAAGGTATLRFVCGNGTNETVFDTGVVMADDTWVDVAVVVANGRVSAYVGGVTAPVAVATSYIPTGAMSLFFQGKTLDTGGDDFSIRFWQFSAEVSR